MTGRIGINDVGLLTVAMMVPILDEHGAKLGEEERMFQEKIGPGLSPVVGVADDDAPPFLELGGIAAD